MWLPVFMGELKLVSAFIPRDWHVHEMLYGFLPAVITGFLFTAIPNWTGRLPLRGRPLMFLVALWIAGTACVTFRPRPAGLRPCWWTAASCCWSQPQRPARSLPARSGITLASSMLILVLLAGNVAFHLEAHFNGAAEYSIRVGIAVVVLLISLIGGRIIPSFTRNWLVSENPGRLPVPFAPLRHAVRRCRRLRAGLLDRFAAAYGRVTCSRSRRHASGSAGTLGRLPDGP